jgi:adenylate cyclase class 2
MTLETELKYLGPDLDHVRQRLRELGARQVSPRELETNELFDDTHASLRSSGRLLRLRNKRELTVKLPMQDDRFKSRQELTVMIAEGDVAALLEGLGYTLSFTYQKYREAWEMDGLKITQDELPFLGAVVEIEGDGHRIDDAAMRLGLGGAPTSVATYLALFKGYAESHGLPPGTQMTFDAEAQLRPA